MTPNGLKRKRASQGSMPVLRSITPALVVFLISGLSLVPAPAVLAQTDECFNGIVVPNPQLRLGLVSDCEALLASQNTLNPKGPLTWSPERPIGAWQGVTLNNSSSRVVELKVHGNMASGRIPPELGRLDALKVLYLTDGTLEGPIPPELGNLSNLSDLRVHGNHLSGSIPPEMGNLSNLRDLHLGDNHLSGPIPPELGNLSNLTWLALYANRLTGSIPSELGNITFLNNLGLFNNQLTGTIPTELGNLEHLDALLVHENNLTGCIPEGLREVQDLQFDQNELRFCGSAPSTMEAPTSIPIPTSTPTLTPIPSPTPAVERGFFFNTTTSHSAPESEGSFDIMDPVTLSLIGVLLTLFATSVQLFKGR